MCVVCVSVCTRAYHLPTYTYLLNYLITFMVAVFVIVFCLLFAVVCLFVVVVGGGGGEVEGGHILDLFGQIQFLPVGGGGGGVGSHSRRAGDRVVLW